MKTDNISRVINMLGIPANIMGFSYLVCAVKICTKDFKYVHNITTKLYPSIAKANGTTSSRVERSIRYAICRCWRKYYKSNIDIRSHIFPYSTQSKTPTNGEFIAQVSDYIINSNL